MGMGKYGAGGLSGAAARTGGASKKKEEINIRKIKKWEWQEQANQT